MGSRQPAVHGLCLTAQAAEVYGVEVIQQRPSPDQLRVSDQHRRYRLDHVSEQFPRISYRSDHQLQNKAKMILAVLSSYFPQGGLAEALSGLPARW